MTIVELHRRAVQRFAALVDAIETSQWTARTPCGDWDVRALVNHVVAEDLWTPPLLGGSTIAEVGDRFEGDVLGSDPAGASRAAANAAVAAAAEPGAMDRTVHLSAGDATGAEYAWQLFADHLVHSWDLARAIGADEHLDADLVTACAGWFGEQEAGWRAAGLIGPRPTLPPDADDQTRLLAAFGRTATTAGGVPA